MAIPILGGQHTLKASETQSLVFTGSGPNRQRQEGAHPHQVAYFSARDELLVPDLGSDVTRRLRRDNQGIWRIEGEVRYAPGSGPRHVSLYSKSNKLDIFPG